MPPKYEGDTVPYIPYIEQAKTLRSLESTTDIAETVPIRAIPQAQTEKPIKTTEDGKRYYFDYEEIRGVALDLFISEHIGERIDFSPNIHAHFLNITNILAMSNQASKIFADENMLNQIFTRQEKKVREMITVSDVSLYATVIEFRLLGLLLIAHNQDILIPNKNRKQ